jgi:hypothetical protein
LNDSILHNPYGPWWFNGGYVFYFLFKKDYQQALHWVEKLNMPKSLRDPLLKAAVLGHFDHKEDAGKHLRSLFGNYAGCTCPGKKCYQIISTIGRFESRNT